MAYTTRDIARLAGVSKSTVSRYISGKKNQVSTKSQRKIAKVIQELDYRPNQVAVSLAKKESKQIGVVIADISNPFSAIVMKGIFDACEQHNLTVSFANSNGNPEREQQNIQNFLSANINRLIINTCGNNERFLERLDTKTTVIVDRPLEHNRFLTVTSNNRDSTYEAVKYLQNSGGYLIAFITPTIGNVITRQIRYEGYVQAVSDRQRPILISYDSQLNADGQLRRLFAEHGRVGIFTVNGEALKTFLRFSKNAQIAIGVDAGVVSFEDWNWMEFITPPITAVRQDSYGMGYKAAEYLLDGVVGEAREPFVERIQSQLIIRESAFR